MTGRRFPPPWRYERIPGGWRVHDGTGRPVAYVYGDDAQHGAGSDKLTVEEGRRIAAQIARLPDLLKSRE